MLVMLVMVVMDSEVLRNSEPPLALAGHGQDLHIPTPATQASTGNFPMYPNV